jgi:hypothetical protein
MPASASRHRLKRILQIERRLAELTRELDTLPNRRAPLAPRSAQRGWRVIDDAYRALRLPLPPESERGREPYKLVWQVVSIRPLLTPARALGIKASPAGHEKTYPRASARV